MQKILIAIAGFILAGSTVGATEARQLVGIWHTEDKGIVCVLRFNENGTFNGNVGPKEARKGAFSGTWRYSKNRIFYTYQTPQAGQDEDQVLAITSSYFIIRAVSGEERRYDRMQEEHNQASEPTAPSGRGSP